MARPPTQAFDDVRIPADHLVGEVEGEGFGVAMKSLVKGRIHIAAVSVGMAKRLIHECLKHTTTNTQGGTRLADFQLVQAMLAESQAEAMAGEAMVLATARAYDDGSDPHDRALGDQAFLHRDGRSGRGSRGADPRRHGLYA